MLITCFLNRISVYIIVAHLQSAWPALEFISWPYPRPRPAPSWPPIHRALWLALGCENYHTPCVPRRAEENEKAIANGRLRENSLGERRKCKQQELTEIAI